MGGSVNIISTAREGSQFSQHLPLVYRVFCFILLWLNFVYIGTSVLSAFRCCNLEVPGSKPDEATTTFSAFILNRDIVLGHTEHIDPPTAPLTCNT